MNKTLKALAFIAFAMSLHSCNSDYDYGVYRIGRTWDFKAYFFDAQNQVKDSCKLQLAIGKGGALSFIMNQRELIYTYGGCCGKPLKETTGVDEQADRIFIHPPRLECFSFTEIPPMPEVGLPINMTSVSTSELKIVKGFDTLNGKTITQTHRPVRWETFNFSDTTIKCVVIEGANTNYVEELGQYKCEYLFNEYFGFVQLAYYKPNGESVKMILRSVSFK